MLRFLTAKLGCREQAADVVQDTFLRVRGVKDLEAIGQPRAFLCKTAINLTVDLFRRQQIRSERTIQPEEMNRVSSEMPRQDCEVEAKERVRLLYAAIDDLPPKCRQVFLLHKFKGLSHADIARKLGISKKHGGKTCHEGDGSLPSTSRRGLSMGVFGSSSASTRSGVRVLTASAS